MQAMPSGPGLVLWLGRVSARGLQGAGKRVYDSAAAGGKGPAQRCREGMAGIVVNDGSDGGLRCGSVFIVRRSAGVVSGVPGFDVRRGLW